MTRADVEALLREWQIRLRMEDWDIQLEWTTPFSLDNDYGDCRAWPSKQHAVIRLCELERWPSNEHEVFHDDPEQCLVHELVHVKSWDLCPDKGDPKLDAYEYLAHSIARALVDLKRSAR